MDDQNKNLILATVLSFVVIMVWFVLFPPDPPPPDVDQIVAEQSTPGVAGSSSPAVSAPGSPVVPGARALLMRPVLKSIHRNSPARFLWLAVVSTTWP